METKSGITLDYLKRNALYGFVASLKPSCGWSDDLLLQKLRASEDHHEHTLGLSLKPRRILCDPPSDKVLGTDYDLREPAYDLEGIAFWGRSWGMVQLRENPVLSVQRVCIQYPLSTTIIELPQAWWRIDYDFGSIRFVPTIGTLAMNLVPLGLMPTGVMGFGSPVPQSLVVDYTVGFAAGELQRNHTDLIENIVRYAVLLMIAGGFLANITMSGETSQSLAANLAEARTAHKEFLTSYRQQHQGPRLMVF